MKWLKIITTDKPLKFGLPDNTVLMIGFGLTMPMLVVTVAYNLHWI